MKQSKDKASSKELHPKLIFRIYGDEKCFGPGIATLLCKVKQFHSLRQAALDMGMAYSKAWTIIHRAQECLGFPLLELKTGGKSGGGASLTYEGERLLASYELLKNELEDYTSERFAHHFSWLNNSEKE